MKTKKNHLLIDFMQISFISWKTMIGAFVDKSFILVPFEHHILLYKYFRSYNRTGKNGNKDKNDIIKIKSRSGNELKRVRIITSEQF